MFGTWKYYQNMRGRDIMELPISAAEPIKKGPVNQEAYIINPYHGKDRLTVQEAMDCINHLSGVLLADGCYKAQREHKKYI